MVKSQSWFRNFLSVLYQRLPTTALSYLHLVYIPLTDSHRTATSRSKPTPSQVITSFEFPHYSLSSPPLPLPLSSSVLKAMDLLDSLSSEQKETLNSFQAITSTEDLDSAIQVLNDSNWNLEVPLPFPSLPPSLPFHFDQFKTNYDFVITVGHY